MRTVDYFDKWIISRYGGNSTKEAIRLAVDDLLAKANQKALPIRLAEVAKVIGINPSPIYKNQTPSAQIILVDNEFRIALKMKSERPPSKNWHGLNKLRFSYAHELMHCLYYDFSTSPPKRIAPHAHRNKEEIMCNYGASLLLLPKQIINEFLANHSNNDIISTALSLADLSKSTLHTVFLRLLTDSYFPLKNRLCILSAYSEGYRGRSIRKPRVILAIHCQSNENERNILPSYKGIEYFNKNWSLLSFHERLNHGEQILEMNSRNENLEIENSSYLVNGTHRKVDQTGYVWSELDTLKLN